MIILHLVRYSLSSNFGYVLDQNVPNFQNSCIPSFTMMNCQPSISASRNIKEKIVTSRLLVENSASMFQYKEIVVINVSGKFVPEI